MEIHTSCCHNHQDPQMKLLFLSHINIPENNEIYLVNSHLMSITLFCPLRIYHALHPKSSQKNTQNHLYGFTHHRHPLSIYLNSSSNVLTEGTLFVFFRRKDPIYIVKYPSPVVRRPFLLLIQYPTHSCICKNRKKIDKHI